MEESSAHAHYVRPPHRHIYPETDIILIRAMRDSSADGHVQLGIIALKKEITSELHFHNSGRRSNERMASAIAPLSSKSVN